MSGRGSGGVIVFIMGAGRGGVGLGGQSSTTSIAPQQQQQQQQQRSLHFEAQQTPVMDEFLEDMFAMPWDYNAGQGAMMMERAGTGAAMAGVEAASNINHNSNIGGSSSMAAATQQQQKMFSMPLIQQQPRLLNNNGSGALSGVNQAQLVSSQASQLSSQQQQQGKEFESSRILVILFPASRGRSSVTLFFQGCSLSSGCRCWTIGLLSFTV